MFSDRKRATLASLAVLVGLTVAGAAQAQAVVVRSTGPSASAYPQGKKLAADAKVTLKAGDRLTVLDKAGTRVLAGPGSFTLDSRIARDATAIGRVSGVLASAGGTRTRTGAVRGAPMGAPAASVTPAGPDSVWYLDVSKSGAFCVADPGSVVLWRPDRANEASGKLTLAGGKPVEVSWRKGNPLKLWPVDQLPLTDGATYSFAGAGGASATITVHLLSAVPGDDIGVASLLADRGCKSQLDVYANAAEAAAQGG